MNKTTISLFFITLLSIPLASANELSSTVTFVSDYRYNGISQTAGDPAVQGSIDFAFENGIYLGVWGSNVDFGDDANLEVDYYIGYANGFDNGVDYNLTALYYTYPGYKASDIDYFEFSSGLTYSGFSVYYNYADNFANTGESGQYIGLDYKHKITDYIFVHLHAGHSFDDYWGTVDIQDYEDYSIGLSTEIYDLDILVSWLFNDISDAETVDDGVVRNDDTLMFSVSRTF